MQKAILPPNYPVSKITVHNAPTNSHLMLGSSPLVELSPGTNVISFEEIFEKIWQREKEFFSFEKGDPRRQPFVPSPAELMLIILSGVACSDGAHINDPPPKKVNLFSVNLAIQTTLHPCNVEFE